LARQLDDAYPDAAASLREGLEDMFTVRRLGVSDRLAWTLSSTNAIESMITAAARPCMSSGEIGGHTRMTGPTLANCQRWLRQVGLT
jgi:hypothetical protein